MIAETAKPPGGGPGGCGVAPSGLRRFLGVALGVPPLLQHTPSAPLVTQYNTRPAGKKANITAITSGIICIIFFCMGSMPTIGVIFWSAT